MNGRSAGSSVRQFLILFAAINVALQHSPSVDAFSPAVEKNSLHRSFISTRNNNQGLKQRESLRFLLVRSSTPDDQNNESNNSDSDIENLEDDIVKNLAQSSANQFDNFERPLDPFMAAVTQMDDKTANAPTVKVPLLGEIPIDGSILVLVPTVLIAVGGFVFSIIIGIQSKDAIADQITQVTQTLSTPPVKTQTVVTDGCRGLCSDQAAQLETMRGFMQSLARDKPADVIVPTTNSNIVLPEQ
eukprot:CAMPEP_0197827416 /NCGR_PEP_ID=MMETSP1437-20131217/4197_1 /TAXON_ID=49252 ORGANISM="Eucampia antarctica, Strain CCMP1452" /NCGR_SAMPLE_ID=MMETSP1437 /ASSEMBLY_ACC=CAM_ASM_001096 /LENGTH=243 /DNA_ID=CAMNT_0043428245 /DNA_START=39 /DNA_END=770 /DNA_ORIENTATION=-